MISSLHVLKTFYPDCVSIKAYIDLVVAVKYISTLKHPLNEQGREMATRLVDMGHDKEHVDSLLGRLSRSVFENPSKITDYLLNLAELCNSFNFDFELALDALMLYDADLDKALRLLNNPKR